MVCCVSNRYFDVRHMGAALPTTDCFSTYRCIFQRARSYTNGSYCWVFRTASTTTLVYSTVWHLMLASLADLRHSSVTDRMARLRQWCLLSHDLYTLSVQRNFAGPSKFRRDIAAAIFECTASMLAPNMRTWFAQHNDMQAILSAEPPNCFFRRRV